MAQIIEVPRSPAPEPHIARGHRLTMSTALELGAVVAIAIGLWQMLHALAYIWLGVTSFATSYALEWRAAHAESQVAAREVDAADDQAIELRALR